MEQKDFFFYREEMPEKQTVFSTLLVVLGAFSIWGNYEQNKEEYMS